MNIFGYLVDFFPFLQNPTIFQLLKFMIEKKKKSVRCTYQKRLFWFNYRNVIDQKDQLAVNRTVKKLSVAV